MHTRQTLPAEPEWHTRTYFHHLVRMPYMLADLGRIFNPVLNIVDGLVAQAGQEWGNGLEEGSARTASTLIAGNHTIATDACAAVTSFSPVAGSVTCAAVAWGPW